MCVSLPDSRPSLWRPLVIMVCLLRYAQVIEHSHHCLLNTSALVSGCTNAVGLVMVGNFQVKPEGGAGLGAGHTYGQWADRLRWQTKQKL